MKNLVLCSILCALALAVSGCSDRKNVSPMPSITSEEKKELAKPVDCSTAQQDIATLEKERASVGGRIVAGVRSIFPIAAVAGILTGDYSDRVAVASGKYNDDIAAKIEEIKSVCGLR